MLTIALVASVLGVLSLQMAIAPGYVAPFFPPAGIALAAALMFGTRSLPAIFFASFITNAVSSLNVGLALDSVMTAGYVSVGACVQAMVGRYLVMRFADFPSALDRTYQTIHFLILGGPVACLVNASLSVPLLVSLGAIPAEEQSFSWLNWWAGDALGVLVFSPLVLAIFNFPDNAWRSRRRVIIWPLTLAVGMLAAMIFQVGQWENERLKTSFQRDARGFSEMLISRVTDQMDALHATSQAVAAQGGASGPFFRSLTAPWLERYQGMYVIGWAPRVEADDLDVFSSWARSNIAPTFEVFTRDDAGNRRPVSPEGFHLPIVRAEPAERNSTVIGLDPMGFSLARTALDASMRSGNPAATVPLRLQQEPDDQRSVLVYQVVRELQAGEFGGRMIGVVYIGLRLADVLEGVLARQTDHALSVCLYDQASQHIHLFGKADCELKAQADTPMHWSAPFSFAGRTWVIDVEPKPGYGSTHRSLAAWVVLIINPLAVGLLGAFLLVTTGHTQRVEALVRERTRQLESSGEQLRAGREALARAQALAQMGSWELEPSSGRVDWSEQMREMFHFDEAVTGNMEQLFERTVQTDSAKLRDAIGRLECVPGAISLDCRFKVEGEPVRVGHFQMESEVVPAQGLLLRGTVRDVTDARAAEAHINRLARFDGLTGLPNRATWTERVYAQVRTASRHEERFAVLFIDLDNFKTVNDSLGHAQGDRLLAMVSKRLSSVLREDDMLARQGGDEFVALLTRLPRAEDAAAVASKMIEAMARPFMIDHNELLVSVSIGISLYPQDAHEADALITQADLAMYSAKESGRNGYAFFHEDMNARAHRQMQLYNALRRAEERGEFALFFQAQVDAASGRVIGYEALLRWKNDKLGTVSPDEFIPIAETSGLMLAIGEWVLRAAFRQQVRWQQEEGRQLRVAVNISALQFRHINFIATLSELLQETGANPRQIELEITESALMQMGEGMVDRLEQLKRLGFTLALDDFGTGYSSLAYLKRFPIERLKLDRSFVRDLPHDADDCAIAQATLSMARDLGMDVVAEGVETDAQRDYLVKAGCALLQGYLFGRPQPVSELKMDVAAVKGLG
ncbi:EAL domain-containing protein [Nitrogeniibacter aestuarii]|uniref:EAL domain-containing protein n=1 Tax=Nitrogeniibacter aestuarii TaxID=2815343 RepID=UPI001D10AA41|nr:EAL domain-containing protein [Nitrogeniibacter aestuarii]